MNPKPVFSTSALVAVLSACALALAPARAAAGDPEPEEASGASATTPVTGPRNLLHPDYCEIIAAPSDRPAKLLEGGFDLPADELAEAIYAFKGERGARVTGVRVFINGSADQAIKSVEILSAESADGPFTAAAKAGDTKNLKLFKTKGWQEFTFDPVEIRFFKVNAAAHNHAWVRVENDGLTNGLQFIGEPLP